VRPSIPQEPQVFEPEHHLVDDDVEIVSPISSPYSAEERRLQLIHAEEEEKLRRQQQKQQFNADFDTIQARILDIWKLRARIWSATSFKPWWLGTSVRKKTLQLIRRDLQELCYGKHVFPGRIDQLQRQIDQKLLAAQQKVPWTEDESLVLAEALSEAHHWHKDSPRGSHFPPLACCFCIHSF
jgi:hypothetical protein